MSAPKWDGLILARNGALEYIQHDPFFHTYTVQEADSKKKITFKS